MMLNIICGALWCGLAVLAGSALAAGVNYQDIVLNQFQTLRPVQLSSLDQTKPTYLKFWASWCQPCMEQMPHFASLQQQYGDKVNFVAVNVNINEDRQHINDVIQKFSLKMPVLLDNDGQLALALGLVGTPYSLLMNTDGTVVYNSHESDAALDKMLARLAQGEKLAPSQTEQLTAAEQAKLIATYQAGEQLVFVTATWCDWYLLETRPAMAQQCKQAQTALNAIYQQLPDKKWRGLVNHLWTDDAALAEFNKLYQMQVPFSVDQFGVLFTHFNVRHIPVLLRLQQGKVVAQISDFSDPAAVVKQLSLSKTN